MPLGRPTEIRVTTDRVPDACRVGIADLRVVAVRRRSARGRSLVFERVRGRIGGEQLPLDARVHGQAQRGEQQFVRHLSIENQREIRNGEKYETEGGGERDGSFERIGGTGDNQERKICRFASNFNSRTVYCIAKESLVSD